MFYAVLFIVQSALQLCCSMANKVNQSQFSIRHLVINCFYLQAAKEMGLYLIFMDTYIYICAKALCVLGANPENVLLVRLPKSDALLPQGSLALCVHWI